MPAVSHPSTAGGRPNTAWGRGSHGPMWGVTRSPRSRYLLVTFWLTQCICMIGASWPFGWLEDQRPLECPDTRRMHIASTSPLGTTSSNGRSRRAPSSEPLASRAWLWRQRFSRSPTPSRAGFVRTGRDQRWPPCWSAVALRSWPSRSWPTVSIRCQPPSGGCQWPSPGYWLPPAARDFLPPTSRRRPPGLCWNERHQVWPRPCRRAVRLAGCRGELLARWVRVSFSTSRGLPLERSSRWRRSSTSCLTLLTSSVAATRTDQRISTRCRPASFPRMVQCPAHIIDQSCTVISGDKCD